MADTDKLICPITQENCEFESLCASKKEILDEGGTALESPMGQVFARYPHAAAAYDSSHCIDKRIEALIGLVSVDGVPAREFWFASMDVARALEDAKDFSQGLTRPPL